MTDVVQTSNNAVNINNNVLQCDNDVTNNDVILQESPSYSPTPSSVTQTDDVVPSPVDDAIPDDDILHSDVMRSDNCDDNKSIASDSDRDIPLIDSSDDQNVDSTLMLTDDQNKDVSEGEIVSEEDDREKPSGSGSHDQCDNVFEENPQGREDKQQSENISCKHRLDSQHHQDGKHYQDRKYHQDSKHHQDRKHHQDIQRRRDRAAR